MKTGQGRPFNLNFAGHNYRLLFLIRRGLAAASTVLIVAVIAIVAGALQTRSEIAALNVRLAELTAQHETVRPFLAEREQFITELQAMSALIEAKKFSWTRFLTDVERVFPTGVALSSVVYSPKDRSVALYGTALSPEALRNLIVGLEQSPSFLNPLLKHQSIEKGSISFDVVAIYKGGPAPADQRASDGQGK